MATHDYVIDNSTGANVRADINLVLQAILTNNSSSSAPSTTAAYMFWADTTTGTLKIRNSSDNAWVELLQLDGTLTLEDGSVSSPALGFRDDLNTGIYSSAADTFNVATGGVERMELGSQTVFNESGADVDFRIEGDTDENLFRVDASTNRIGIGQSSPEGKFHIETGSSGASFSADNSDLLILEHSDSVGLDLRSPAANSGNITFSDANARGQGRIAYEHNNDAFFFCTGGIANERMRIDSSGRILIGTTTEGEATADNLTIADSGHCGITLRSGTSSVGTIFFSDATSGGDEYIGSIQYDHSGNFLKWTVNGSERMRVHSGGQVSLGHTTTNTTSNGVLFVPNGTSGFYSGGTNALHIGRGVNDGDTIIFNRSGTNVGSISVTTSATAYNTSSDYRLKENVVAISDGITRLKTLKPSRFNFKVDKDTTVDGFLAHEVTAVPEAITGTKDEVDSDNNPVYQGIDQSKLVPLLVAAVQELITKVETLEAA